ncbi:MAG: transposase [Candidatus Micrarchaeaceae archaeon]
MYSIRAYKFRIYPDAKRRQEIDSQIALAQRLYNSILERAKKAYEKDKNSKVNISTLNRYMQESINANKDFLKLYSQTRQDIFIRLLKAFQNFFRRIKEKEQGKKVKLGFPRFKSIDRYKSVTYPQDNGAFSIESERKTDMLRVARIGRMKIEMHRKINGKIKTLTIKKEGKEYYAIFTAVEEITPPAINDTNPVGIDMGLHNFIALSDGKTIQKPNFFKKRAKRIAHWQRVVARRKKGSKRRQKAKEKLQKEWTEVTNQSNDFMHKLSDRLVHEGYTSFAVEALNIQNMEKSHRLAQAIQNAAWRRFISMISYKAESAGKIFITVPAEDTTQECSRCGNIKKGKDRLTLNDRIYNCKVCGLTMDRDLNSSIVILKRGLLARGRAGPAQTDAQGENRQYNANSIANGLEELRTYPGNFRGKPRSLVRGGGHDI